MECSNFVFHWHPLERPIKFIFQSLIPGLEASVATKSNMRLQWASSCTDDGRQKFNEQVLQWFVRHPPGTLFSESWPGTAHLPMWDFMRSGHNGFFTPHRAYTKASLSFTHTLYLFVVDNNHISSLKRGKKGWPWLSFVHMYVFFYKIYGAKQSI